MAITRARQLKPQYDAMRCFVERALRDGDSMFTPGSPVWSAQTVQDLYQRFVGRPDTSADSFDVKLERQLKGAPALTIQLAAELLFIHFLPGDSTTAEHKRYLINTVLSWAPASITIPPSLTEAMEKGLAAEGVAFKIYRPFLLQYLIEFLQKWWKMGAAERSRALTDPWAFKEAAWSVTVPKAQSQAELLLHIVHPDTFEHIMSRKQKRRIAEAFPALLDEPTEDVDRQLLQIRRKLTEQEGREISFYEPKIRSKWEPESDPWAAFIKHAGVFFRLPQFDRWEREYKEQLAEKMWPVIGELADRSDDALERLHRILRAKDQNIVRWQDFEPFVKWYRDHKPLGLAAIVGIRDTSRSPGDRVRAFLDPLPRDVVKSPGNRTTLASLFLSASDPHKMVVFRAKPFGWAVKQVDYEPLEHKADEGRRYEHAIDFCERFVTEAAQRGLSLRDRLDAQGLIWTMANCKEAPEHMDSAAWEEFVQYRGKALPDEPDDDAPPAPAPALDPPALEADPIGRLLLRRKNVVLYGPPGTGKTHASLALAAKWRRSFGEGSVSQVTFHPTFAYEDFVEGFRPDSSGRFERRDGLFVRTCEAAHLDPRRPFLLIIDELNRGDVARVFGELITLIEPDKRHAGARRTLPYSQRDMWVPPNLHLLGTMNTADRSISLLDVAIRRRFCFKEFAPEASAISTSTAHYSEVAGVPLAALLVALNARLLEIGVSRDRAIGHSHFLIAASEPRPLEVLRERFQYDIVPLVEEYCYADRPRLRQVFDRLVTEEGELDEDILGDDTFFAKALLEIVSAEVRAARPPKATE